MKAIPLILVFITVFFGCNSKKNPPAAKSEVPSTAVQIKTALLAAPPEKRDSCTVYGYSPDKQLVVLKQGTNEMICLAEIRMSPAFQWHVMLRTSNLL